MNRHDIENLIAQGESQTLEFKESLSQQRPAIKTLAAFASEPAGGVVLFGVKDDRTIRPVTIGAQTLEKLAGDIKINSISMATAEPLLPTIEVVADLGIVVVLVPVDAEREGPYLAFGRRFKRVGRSTHEVKLDYRQLARAFRQHLYDDDSDVMLGFRFCPECGSEKLQRRDVQDPSYDRMYYTIRCQECRWSEWTE